MRTVGKIELDIVEMLVCTSCEEMRDPEDYALVLKECRREDCSEKAAVDPDERLCPSCEKQTLVGGKDAPPGCEDCNEEMELRHVVVCAECAEPLNPECGHKIEVPDA
jgi:hypothetical protein